MRQTKVFKDAFIVNCISTTFLGQRIATAILDPATLSIITEISHLEGAIYSNMGFAISTKAKKRKVYSVVRRELVYWLLRTWQPRLWLFGKLLSAIDYKVGFERQRAIVDIASWPGYHYEVQTLGRKRHHKMVSAPSFWLRGNPRFHEHHRVLSEPACFHGFHANDLESRTEYVIFHLSRGCDYGYIARTRKERR